jgi:CheY-like chemotaxis protein
MAAAWSHWIVRVGERVGVPQGALGDLGPETSVPEAWARLAAVSGKREDELARVIADQFHLRVADLSAVEPQAIKLVPEAIARRHQVLPLREDDRDLVVATGDPTDLELEQVVGFASGRRVVFEIAPPTGIAQAIDARYSPERVVEGLLQAVDASAVEEMEVVSAPGTDTLAAGDAESAPVVKLANLILQAAVAQGAADIQFEPGGHGGHVRFHVEGVLRPYMPLPMSALNRVVSHIKMLGGLDTAGRSRPQHGRTRVRVRGRVYDLRLSTVPSLDSEMAVVRIIDPQGAPGLTGLVEGPAAREPAQQAAHADVLLVDDDSIVRSMARALLEKNGLTVAEVPDGVAALERLATGAPPSLVVLDLEMPRLDGREVLRRLRADVRTAGLPVIVLTGAEGGTAEVELMEAGADDYIRKPMDPPRFVARVRAALRRAGS